MMIRVRIFSRLLLWIFVGIGLIHSNLSSVNADDWLLWRGPSGNGISESQKPPLKWAEELNIIWQSKVPGRGHSSPILVGERVYLTTANENSKTQSILCYARSSGKKLWEKQVHQGKFATRIHQKNTHASPTIASDGKHLFAFFNNDKKVWLTKFDMNGNQVWQKEAGQFVPYYPFGFAASPTIWKNLVIVSAESEKFGFLCAYDKDSGEEVWRAERQATSYSSPIVGSVGGKSQVLLSGGSKVAGYDPTDGKKLWSAPAVWQVSCGTLVWSKDKVFASGGFPRAQTLCVKADGSGEIVWQNRVKCYEQSMLFHDGYLYGISDAGIGYCWDANERNGNVERSHGRTGQLLANTCRRPYILFVRTWRNLCNQGDTRQV